VRIGNRRTEATAAPATVSGEHLPNATELRPPDGSGRRQGATTREPGNLPSMYSIRVPGGVPRREE
jgi:hypothetical protein